MNGQNFTKVNNDFLFNRQKELSSSAFRVYVTLRGYADWTKEDSINGAVWPSYDTILEITGMSKPTFSSAITELIEKGWITDIQRRWNDSNVYTLGDGENPNTELLERRKAEGKKYARKNQRLKNFTSRCKEFEPLEVKNSNSTKNQLPRTINQESSLSQEEQTDLGPFYQENNDCSNEHSKSPTGESTAANAAVIIENFNLTKENEVCSMENQKFPEGEKQEADPASNTSEQEKIEPNYLTFSLLEGISEEFLNADFKFRQKNKQEDLDTGLLAETDAQREFLSKFHSKAFRTTEDKELFTKIEKYYVPVALIPMILMSRAKNYELGLEELQAKVPSFFLS